MANKTSQIKVEKARPIGKNSHRCVGGVRHNSTRLNHAFFSGFTTIFAIYPLQRVIRFRTPFDDRNHIASDWRVVGNGIRQAMIELQFKD